jgi:putative transposase
MPRWLEKSDYRRGRSCVFDLHVHLVFITKKRRHALTGNNLADLKGIFDNVCSKSGSILVEMDGEDDHVHLLVRYPPTLKLSSLVNSLKGVSSRLLRKDDPRLAKEYGLKHHLWSPSYFAASCGGAPIAVIRKYIEHQKTPRQTG